MPSTIAVLIGLNYKTTDLQDVGESGFPRVFLQLVEGGPDDTPDVRGDDRTMPYRDGQLYGNRREDRLPIMLKGWVAGEGDDEAEQREDTAAARQEMRVLFDRTSGPGTLLVTTEDGVEWEIEAYPDGLVWENPDEGIPTHRGVSIRLMAVDPPHWTVVPPPPPP